MGVAFNGFRERKATPYRFQREGNNDKKPESFPDPSWRRVSGDEPLLADARQAEAESTCNLNKKPNNFYKTGLTFRKIMAAIVQW